MTLDEMRETAPEVFVPTDDDHDPDRVIRDASRNATIVKGVLAATHVYQPFPGRDPWQVGGMVKGHRTVFYEKSLADAFRLLGEAVENEPQTE